MIRPSGTNNKEMNNGDTLFESDLSGLRHGLWQFGFWCDDRSNNNDK